MLPKSALSPRETSPAGREIGKLKQCLVRILPRIEFCSCKRNANHSYLDRIENCAWSRPGKRGGITFGQVETHGALSLRPCPAKLTRQPRRPDPGAVPSRPAQSTSNA